MALLRRLKKQNKEQDEEDDFVDCSYTHRRVVDFHPHCYVQQLALAESRRFDEIYALAHEPARGDEGSEA